MANKSFIVQYIIKARDKFSSSANRAAKSINKFGKETDSAGRKLPKFNSKARKSAAILKILAMQARKSSASMSKFGRKIRNVGAVMSAAITLPIGFMGRAMINAASDSVETANKFDAVFDDVKDKANKVADSFAKNFGVAGSTARKMIGDTGDLLVGFNFSGDAALEMAKKVAIAGSDLASFANFAGGAEGASLAITKALLGETESTKALGVVIRQGTPEFKRNVAILQKTRGVTLLQAKALEILRIVQSQSKKSVGDVNRTWDDYASVARRAKESTKELSESLGMLLLPAANKITNIVIRFVKWMTSLSPVTKGVILVVAGLLAVLGPLAVVLSVVILALPALITGFAALTAGLAAMTLAAGTLLLPIVVFASLAALIMLNWGKVSAFFGGIADGISRKFGPTLTRLISKFKEAAFIIASLFSSDSEAAKNLTAFANIGELVGDIIGGALDIIVRALSGIGAIIGQVLGAVFTLDFGAFDTDAIKAEFSGTPAVSPPTRVDVGVQVGLDQGLQQTSPAAVTSNNARRADVGLTTGD